MGDRVTVKALGLNTIHRMLPHRGAKQAPLPDFYEMVRLNKSAESRVDQFNAGKERLKAAAKRRVDDFRDGVRIICYDRLMEGY